MNAGAYSGEIAGVNRVGRGDGAGWQMSCIQQGRNGVRLSHEHCKNKALRGAQHCFKAAKRRPKRNFCYDAGAFCKASGKQPLEYPSAGSTFKRPAGIFCRQADYGCRTCRSVRRRRTGFRKHCGFVINRKNATSADVAGLIQKVTETVQEKFGVTLEPEVIFLGDFEK